MSLLILLLNSVHMYSLLSCFAGRQTYAVGPCWGYCQLACIAEYGGSYRFFWRSSEANAAYLGHHPTVTPFESTKELTKESLSGQLQFAADPGDIKVEGVNFFEVLLPRDKRRYVIGKATYLGVASLTSRATRSFKAWYLTTGKPVRLNISQRSSIIATFKIIVR